MLVSSKEKWFENKFHIMIGDDSGCRRRYEDEQKSGNKEVQRKNAYLRFDQDQIKKKDNKIMLDIFVCKTLAPRALCQANTFSQGAVIGLTVCRVQTAYRIPALDAYGHCI